MSVFQLCRFWLCFTRVAAFSVGLLLVSGADVCAAVKVEASFEAPVVHPSEVIRYFISVQSDQGFEAMPPDLRGLADFSVLSNSESNSKSSTLVMNGQSPQFQTQIEKRFIFELEAKRTGTLKIAGIEVEVGTERIKVPEAVVRVDPAHRGQAPPAFPSDSGDEIDDLFSQLLQRGLGQRPRSLPGQGARTLPQNPDEAFFIQVETDKTEAFVGEQVTVSFYLYTTGLVRDLDTLKYPSLRGFWKEDIEIATHLNYQSEVVNGIAYKKALLASFALFPIKEGTAEVDSYKAKCTVLPGDPFGSFGKAYTFTKASLPIKIKVKPLPTESMPPDFIGTVGDFQVSSRVDDRQPIQHQPFPLKIRFEGRGNAKLVELPSFNAPDGLELYDTQKEARFYSNGLSFKEFTLLLIPRRSGEFTIPSLTVSVFDPATARFLSRKTEPIVLNVIQGAIGSSQAQQYGGGAVLKPDESSGAEAESEWVPVQRPLDRASSQSGDFLRSGLFLLWLYPGAAALSVLVWLYFWQISRRTELLRVRIERKMKVFEGALQSKDVRMIGSEALNLLAIVLSALAGSRMLDRELRKLVTALPPAVTAELGADLQRFIEQAEKYAFSQTERLNAVSAEETQAFAVGFRAVLEKLIALADSSIKEKKG